MPHRQNPTPRRRPKLRRRAKRRARRAAKSNPPPGRRNTARRTGVPNFAGGRNAAPEGQQNQIPRRAGAMTPAAQASQLRRTAIFRARRAVYIVSFDLKKGRVGCGQQLSVAFTQARRSAFDGERILLTCSPFPRIWLSETCSLFRGRCDPAMLSVGILGKKAVQALLRG